MELSQKWREDVSNQLSQAEGLLATAQTVEDWQHAETHFVAIEQRAVALLQEFPETEGKQPFEGDFRSSSAGRLLCGVMRCIQALRDGGVSKDEARKEIQTLAVQLLNLRADHGRFFDKSLNDRINQVERIYQKLLKKA